jgi:hypothetical protein
MRIFLVNACGGRETGKHDIIRGHERQTLSAPWCAATSAARPNAASMSASPLAGSNAAAGDGTDRASALRRAGAKGAGVVGPALQPLALVGLIVLFSFQAGGYFPAPIAAVTVGLLLVLALRVAISDRPLALSRPLCLAVGALALLTVWTLLSSTWSGATARAVTEYDRALLYLVALLLGGALGRTSGRLRWMVRATAAAAVVVCACALVTRLLPDVWSIRTEIVNGRLSYPLTYWNALGLLAAIGGVLCLGLTCDDREAAAGRVAAAAALPLLATTLLLTFSRGSVAVAILGVVTLMIVGRPRAFLTGLIVAVPTVWFALRAGWDADLLAGNHPPGAAVTEQGHHVARTVVECVVVAAIGRAALLKLDPWLVAQVARVWRPRRAVQLLVLALVVFAAAGVAVSSSVPSKVRQQYERFVDGGPIGVPGDLRTRLRNPDNDGRIAQWRVAIDTFHAQPWHGAGAGTYALQWDRARPRTSLLEDAHSLYAEILGELGIVGLLLVATTLLLIAGAFLGLARGPDRGLGGALFAAATVWLVHAGIEWDWEMPAVSLWLFAVGGMALAGRARDGRPIPAARTPLGLRWRVLLGAGCVVLMALPLAVYRSDRALRAAADAFAVHDCPRAIQHALTSTARLGVRPEPFVILGYCDVRLGRPQLAVHAFRNAIGRDPDDWEMHYGMALARASAGRDPRPELRIAHRLNPREPLPAMGLTRFASANPRAWRARAAKAPLPAA